MMNLPLWAYCSLLAAAGATHHLEVIAWPSFHVGIYLHETNKVFLLKVVDPAVTQYQTVTVATLGTASTILSLFLLEGSTNTKTLTPFGRCGM